MMPQEVHCKAHRFAQAGCICHVLCNPAGLKASAVVQPVIWPVVKSGKVNVRGHMVSQKVLTFIVRPTAVMSQYSVLSQLGP